MSAHPIDPAPRNYAIGDFAKKPVYPRIFSSFMRKGAFCTPRCKATATAITISGMPALCWNAAG